jgi:CBS domain containing-hemolysin-like protein
MTSTLLRLIGVPATSDHESPHSPEELRNLASHARSHGELSSWEHRLVEAAFDFEETVCRQIMVPRNEIVFLDINTPLDEMKKSMKKSQHTRYPVCEGSMEKVLGIMHVKDLVGLADGSTLRSILRPPRYVPETAHISRLLGHFQSTRQHLALVVDEHGMLVGIVTLENVLEKIVGPVRDEFDVEMPDIVPEGDGQLMIKGKTPIADLAAALDQCIEAEGVDTAGGLMAQRLGKIPAVGECVPLDGFKLIVTQVRHNHATRIRAIAIKNQEEDGAISEPAAK